MFRTRILKRKVGRTLGDAHRMGSRVKKKTLKRETKCRFPEGDSQSDL